MIPAPQALELVVASLNRDVLPALEDRHATSALKACVGILRNVAAQLERPDDPDRVARLAAAEAAIAAYWRAGSDDPTALKSLRDAVREEIA